MDKRTIVSVVVADSSVYKTVQFNNSIYCGDPINVCTVFSDLCVDEILLIDKTARLNGLNKPMLKEIISDCFVPISYCGGAISISDFENLINIGFDRIGFNLKYYQHENSDIRKAYDRYGRQSIFGILSYDSSLKLDPARGYNFLAERLKSIEKNLFAEIVLQDMSRDGMRTSPDLHVLSMAETQNLGNLVLACGASSSEQVSELKATHNISVAVSSLSTLYRGKGVLLQCP